MRKIVSHKDLKVWQESMDFAVLIYSLTESFPKTEIYGLISQLRRASVSIPSNIAEGFARKGKCELSHFLYISLGSLSEVETQIELAHRLNFIENNQNDLCNEKIKFIRVLLSKLIKSINSTPQTP